jgi:hypothetical protein
MLGFSNRQADYFFSNTVSHVGLNISAKKNKILVVLFVIFESSAFLKIKKNKLINVITIVFYTHIL